MKKSLIKKVLELRDAGLTTVDIAEELNVSVDTALYLVLNGEKLLKESEELEEQIEKKTDIFVNWDDIKISPKRLRCITSIMCDMLKDIDFEVVLGISTGGIPLGILISEELEKDFSVYIPKKHLQGREKTIGFIGHNYQRIKGRGIVVVDDVITSGNTIKESINYVKGIGDPRGAIVVIDKSGIEEIEGVPVRALFRVGTVELSR
ncbi:MAG TPA: orotate phosphoribosyltransferase-like protein [Methanothermococcus okinawensis]|uniref:Transcriptional regulator GfcR n=1 Tax=Methanothermococcus okinawensis TaxID=155863 RepID=A0A832ZIW8_9EURY|nr:orotate phosphoribosyltransferase-like protein [Methanococcaceae archaeon]HIP84719.1 orotate phosphoribosyltransferase-like protein [Methanothermococcus okinawensis]HIP90869.1 orotate phosphoribosyltransferase-like protein [Methanothermococcus okinawensis]